MNGRLKQYYKSFPRQLWVLAAGSFVNSFGAALVYPFLTLYLRQRLGIPLAQVGLLLTLNSATGLVAGMVGGILADRIGRRTVMLISLLSTSAVLFLMGVATSFAHIAALMVAIGITSPLAQPARDAMVADLTRPEQRTEAYSVLRISSNLGWATGPAIGGFLAGVSYLLSFGLAAGACFIFFALTLFLVRETMPQSAQGGASQSQAAGFRTVFRDAPFLLFCGLMVLTTISYSQVMTNLPVYMKESFGLGERYYGWVMTTNGAMVVGLQLWVTRATSKWPRLPALALGSMLYGIGVGAIGLMSSFPGFILCAVIYTLGEVVVSPTATALTAAFAPADMRGRYMGVLGLTWGMAFGIGPMLGGVIYDAGFVHALWLAAGGLALVAAVGYLALQRRARARIAPDSG